MSAETILTLANGRGIDLRAPKPSDIDFSAYAEHLAKEKRYNGATPGVEYSVAQHLVVGADAILVATGDETLAAYFALHDAPEAVLKDDTTPKKRALAEECEQSFGILAEHVLDAFRRIDDRHDAAIHAAAGMLWPAPEWMRERVKHWDLVMFVTEWRDLMPGVEHPHWEPYRDIKPLYTTIIPWGWERAASSLLARWQRLLPALRAEAA